MVTEDELRREIRLEVTRRELDLRTERAIAVEAARRNSYGGRPIRVIEDELAELTGIPARLSDMQKRALKLAVEAYRVQEEVGHAVLDTNNNGVSPSTIHSLARRGLMVVKRLPNDRFWGGELTMQGLLALLAMKRSAERRAEWRRFTMVGPDRVELTP